MTLSRQMKYTMLELINEYRVEHGRAPLRRCKTLSAVAKSHNEDQAFVLQEASHTGSDGSSLQDRLNRYKAQFLTHYYYATEIVGAGLCCTTCAHYSFYTSPVDNTNMLSHDVGAIGINTVTGNDGRRYWALVFRRTKDSQQQGGSGREEEWKTQVFELINEYRTSHGRRPLRLNVTLSNIAKIHAEDKAFRTGSRSYTSTDGPTVTQILKQHNIKTWVDSSSVSVGSRGPEQVHRKQYQYSDYRSLILGRYYDEIGLHLCIGWDEQMYLTEIYVRRVIDPEETPGLLDKWKNTLLNYINEFRTQNGLSPVRMSDKLSRVARLHNEDSVAYKEECSHSGSDGSDLQTRLARQEVQYLLATENVASGQLDPEEAHESFCNSPGHAENMLLPDIDHVGLHVGLDKDNLMFWTEVFAQLKG